MTETEIFTCTVLDDVVLRCNELRQHRRRFIRLTLRTHTIGAVRSSSRDRVAELTGQLGDNGLHPEHDDG